MPRRVCFAVILALTALVMLLGLAATALRLPRGEVFDPTDVAIARAQLACLGLAGVLGAAVLMVAPVRRGLWRFMQRLRHPSKRLRRLIMLAIFVGSVAYMLLSWRLQHRYMRPSMHDEFSYVIQTQMLAHGRLWMPAHPLKDFFENFYLIVDPVYASQYFPGAAMLYVPGVWLHLPPWVLPTMVAGLIVAILYRVVSELLDGFCGLLAAMLMVFMHVFRYLAPRTISHPPLLLLALLCFWAYLRWRKSHRIGWVVAMGITAGWAIITRPMDALCLLLPVAVAVCWDLRKQTWRAAMGAVACAVVCMAPFIAVQVIVNIGVTGSAFKTPFTHYAERNLPQSGLGFPAYDPTRKPLSRVEHIRESYKAMWAPMIKLHHETAYPLILADRIGGACHSVMPHWALALLAPIGLFALDRRRLVLWLSLPLFVLAYSFYPLLVYHYTLIGSVGLILTLVLAVRAIELTWPRRRVLLVPVIALAMLALRAGQLPEVNRRVDDGGGARFHSRVDHAMQSIGAGPAVLLVRHKPGRDVGEETVYNWQVAWPDDAPIIKAHDRGDENIAIYRYYADRQPDRKFYRYDEERDYDSPGPPEFLGTARELAAR